MCRTACTIIAPHRLCVLILYTSGWAYSLMSKKVFGVPVIYARPETRFFPFDEAVRVADWGVRTNYLIYLRKRT